MRVAPHPLKPLPNAADAPRHSVAVTVGVSDALSVTLTLPVGRFVELLVLLLVTEYPLRVLE